MSYSACDFVDSFTMAAEDYGLPELSADDCEALDVPVDADERDTAGDAQLRYDAQRMVNTCRQHQDMREALQNVTAALESCLAHYKHLMPQADQRSREAALKEAREVLAAAGVKS